MGSQKRSRESDRGVFVERSGIPWVVRGTYSDFQGSRASEMIPRVSGAFQEVSWAFKVVSEGHREASGDYMRSQGRSRESQSPLMWI